jgi:hypothetical protein
MEEADVVESPAPCCAPPRRNNHPFPREIIPHVTYEIHEVTELRISVPETGRRLLPLPVAAAGGCVGLSAASRPTVRRWLLVCLRRGRGA